MRLQHSLPLMLGYFPIDADCGGKLQVLKLRQQRYSLIEVNMSVEIWQ